MYGLGGLGHRGCKSAQAKTSRLTGTLNANLSRRINWSVGVMRLQFAVFTILLVTIVGVWSGHLPNAGAAEYTGPIFDVHEHASPNTIGSEKELLAMMDANGIAKMILFDQGCCGGQQPDWAKGIFLRHKDRFELFFTKFCYNGLACYTDDHIRVPEDNVALRVKMALDHSYGQYTGIGEMNLRHSPGPCCPWGQTHVPLDNPQLLALYDLLGDRGLPVIIHDELYSRLGSGDYVLNQTLIRELETALDHNKSTIIILAHASNLVPFDPQTLSALMGRHRNLYADLSWGLFDPGMSQSILRPASKNLLEKYADRFMIGFDFQGTSKDSPSNTPYASETIGTYRKILGQLNPVAAKAIAFQNMAEILAKKTPQVTISTTTTQSSAISSTIAATSIVTSTTPLLVPQIYSNLTLAIAGLIVITVVAGFILRSKTRRTRTGS